MEKHDTSRQHKPAAATGNYESELVTGRSDEQLTSEITGTSDPGVKDQMSIQQSWLCFNASQDCDTGTSLDCLRDRASLDDDHHGCKSVTSDIVTCQLPTHRQHDKVAIDIDESTTADASDQTVVTDSTTAHTGGNNACGGQEESISAENCVSILGMKVGPIEIAHHKHKYWHGNVKRSHDRLNAEKNDMWYDAKLCCDSWSDAIQKLIKSANNPMISITQRVRSLSILSVARVIEDQSVVALRDAYEVYRETYLDEVEHLRTDEYRLYQAVQKPKFDKYSSNDQRDRFLKSLPLILVYGEDDNASIKSYLVPRGGIDWANLASKINIGKPQSAMRQTIKSKLDDFLGDALQHSSSARDRHIIKTILLKLTSVNHLESGALGVQMKRQHVKYAAATTNKHIGDHKDRVRSGKYTPYQLNAMKNQESGRLEGSRGKFKCEEYPELTNIMFHLFNSAGDGFSSHPRLICDTLFLNKATWMNMPRCHSILEQVFGIDISLSALYTYTENYKSKTHQARRHQEGKGVNPNIRLKPSTRDGASHQSVNSHYAVANVKYALEDMYSRSGCIIACDNKALVHTDVEVVQRPGKSWKCVVYDDHDWAKDSKRTLCITTYQLVKMTSVSPEACYMGQLGRIPFSQTKLQGPGVSIVKMSFFEKESAMRHFNETMFLLSREELGNISVAMELLCQNF